jgi:translation initiation factor 1A
MPKKKKSGKNSKNKGPTIKRILTLKEDMQEYVLMTKMLGDRKIMVKLPDYSEKMAVIPGRFRKRCWMKAGDILLASWREFQDDKLDIVHKYNDDEARQLAIYQEIPPFFLNNGAPDDKEDIGITFANENNTFDFDEI